jgi:hypothetical protein
MVYGSFNGIGLKPALLRRFLTSKAFVNRSHPPGLAKDPSVVSME